MFMEMNNLHRREREKDKDGYRFITNFSKKDLEIYQETIKHYKSKSRKFKINPRATYGNDQVLENDSALWAYGTQDLGEFWVEHRKTSKRIFPERYV